MIKLFLKGYAIGIANIIPGLSGGTVALVLGIYGNLITIVSRIDHTNLLQFFRLVTSRQTANATAYAIQTWQLKFLLPVFLGMMIAIFSMASFISFLITSYRELAFSFFFGLVLASLYFPFKSLPKITSREIFWFCFAATFLVLIQTAPLWYGDLSRGGEVGLLRYFIGGAVAMATMILPGISGSFMLIIMGVYFDILAAVAALNIVVICVVGCGCLVGMISLAKLVRFLLTNAYSATMAFLMGLMFGSLAGLWPFQRQEALNDRAEITVAYVFPEGLSHALPALLMFGLGVALVVAFIVGEARIAKAKV